MTPNPLFALREKIDEVVTDPKNSGAFTDALIKKIKELAKKEISDASEHLIQISLKKLVAEGRAKKSKAGINKYSDVPLLCDISFSNSYALPTGGEHKYVNKFHDLMLVDEVIAVFEQKRDRQTKNRNPPRELSILYEIKKVIGTGEVTIQDAAQALKATRT